ncbi:MAG TPA: hypothetical protein VF234_07720 [Limnochordia bacterium]
MYRTANGSGKAWGGLPAFDPREGSVIREPDGAGPGFWVGAPTVLYNGERFYLTYRIRRPRPERGVEGRIAVSDDGIHFDDVYRLHKSALGSDSIERCALFRTEDGTFRYYVSYVDPADGRWRIDLLSAQSPDAFDPAARQPALTAADIGAEGVKDPNVYYIGGRYWMFTSYAPTPARAADPAALHGTRDVYNTGLTRSHSGLATSADGVKWVWEGDILSPSADGWDAYAARLGTVVWTPPLFTALYDGSRSVAENYEERCGMAFSFDLRRWERASVGSPWLNSPFGSGSLRYVDVLSHADAWLVYYEMARPDGAHELRVVRLAR